MLKLIHKGDETERRVKIMGVSRARDDRYVPQLLARLDSEETYENKRHIVRALGNIADPRAEPRLLEMLESATGLMLGDVIRSVGQLGLKQAAPRVRTLVHHSVEWVRQNARWALDKLEQDR
ncbi:MAG: HEAT repeat domain-containing protein [Planctomycetes bacterium]|nr:HEAT repeat domain-containing protein [Planctomycetota bacterium]